MVCFENTRNIRRRKRKWRKIVRETNWLGPRFRDGLHWVTNNWTRWNAKKLWMLRLFFESIRISLCMEGYPTLEPRGMLSSHNYSFLCEPLTRNVNKPGRAASRLPFHFRNNPAYSPLYFISDACQFSSVVPLRTRLLRRSLYILDFKTIFIVPEINRLVKLLVGR